MIHVGHGDWVIIDSFLDDRRPAPLTVLKNFGVKDPAEAVKAIVVTHPHDDHYLGIDMVVSECWKSPLYLPDFSSGAYDRGTDADGKPHPIVAKSATDTWIELGAMMAGKGRIRALGRAIAIASGRQIKGALPQFGILARNDLVPGTHSTLYTLSPTELGAKAVRAYFQGLTQDNAERFESSPNLMSATFWLRHGSLAALLGADLDDHDEHGWTAVLRTTVHESWIGSAGLIKVPHHGSDRAWQPDMYEQLSARHLAFVTPHPSGLPTKKTLNALRDSGHETYIAGKTALLDNSSLSSEFGFGFISARCKATDSKWTLDSHMNAHRWPSEPSIY